VGNVKLLAYVYNPDSFMEPIWLFMKRLSLLILFLSAGLCKIQGQSDSSFHEIGLNATYFIEQFSPGSFRNNLISPYMLTYERRFGSLGIRAGLGYNARTRLDLPDDSNGQTTFQLDSLQAFSRVGLVFYKNPHKRWSVKYGIDATFGRISRRSITTLKDLFGNDVTTKIGDRANQAGLSPFLMIQFHMNSHFSFATEILLNGILIRNVHFESNDQFPDFDVNRVSLNTSFTITPPANLYFIYRF
jgi:hypothetical protein